MKKIILASASPRRRELLNQIGIDFEVITSNCDEIITSTDPADVVQELSYQKAMDVYNRTDGDRIVIGADTIVYADGQILGKPADVNECRKMLELIQGKIHYVYTGVTIIEDNTTPVIKSFAESTAVKVYPMSNKEIDDYIATKDPMDKAGSYGIQGYFARFIEGIDGDYNNVVGMPVGRLYQLLKSLEISPL